MLRAQFVCISYVSIDIARNEQEAEFCHYTSVANALFSFQSFLGEVSKNIAKTNRNPVIREPCWQGGLEPPCQPLTALPIWIA